MSDPRTLFVTWGPPVPADRGARVRDLALIQRVATEREVAVLALVGSDEEAEGLEPMRPGLTAVEAVVVPERARRRARLRRGGPRIPRACGRFLNRGALEAFRAAVEREQPDVIQLEHWLLAPLIDALEPEAAAKIAFVSDLHNVASVQYRSMSQGGEAAAIPTAALKSVLVGAVERRWLSRFDAVLVVSERERALAAEVSPTAELEIVPNGVDTDQMRPVPGDGEPGSILMVGNYDYAPNLDGARWLCHAVLPLVGEAHDSATVRLVGPGGGGALEALSQLHGVDVAGRVPDLEAEYRAAQIAVAPLHAGGGTRLKVLEAMALGRPVVSTTLGAEGLGLVAGEHLLVADEAPAFADAVSGLLGSRERREELARAARAEVERSHDWDRSAELLLAAHDRALERAQSRKRRAATA